MSAQQPPPAPPAKFDFEGRKSQIVSHLNSIIQFYRSTTAPVQKVGEPNDVVYRDQAVALSTQAAQLAFQSAKAEADLLAKYQQKEKASSDLSAPQEQQRLQTAEANDEQQVADLKGRITVLDSQIASASAKKRPALETQRKELQSALDLESAMKEALQKIVGMSDAHGATGFAGDIASLERSVPQLGTKATPVAPQLASLDLARGSGVSSQTMALLGLLEAEHTLDGLLSENDDLHAQARTLRAPISTFIRGLIQQGQQLTQQAIGPAAASPSPAPAPNQAQPPANSSQTLESITASFKAVSSASVPLSEEIIVLEQSRANLAAWRAAVDREYKNILQALLLRLAVIAIALGVIFVAGELWTRATNKYVREIRRRRQLLIVRRTVVGFLSAIVLLFGFVTQFNSLATFAGFITAGVAVGLQTILLSVAAYFFIIGRFGIKVGDRISIGGVTGEVIEVGLVRFYLMELAGNGTSLSPSGRVAVFSNAVLFQAGTPLYKQLPGTDYAWHELTIKLLETADYKSAYDEILNVVQAIYDRYRVEIEKQYRNVEQWMHAATAEPAIESRLQFIGGTLQLWARFPVEIKRASTTDQELTEALLKLLSDKPAVKEAVGSTPVVQASVKG